MARAPAVSEKTLTSILHRRALLADLPALERDVLLQLVAAGRTSIRKGQLVARIDNGRLLVAKVRPEDPGQLALPVA